MHQKKRILVVGQHFWPESFRINDICDFLVHDKGCEVDVLCGLPNYPGGKFFDGYSYFRNKKEIHDDINIRRVLEIPRGDNSNLRILINYVSFPFFSLFHIPQLLTKKYDKIFLYQLSPVMMSFAGIFVGRLKRTETIMYVLDLWPENLFSVLDVKNRLLRKLVTNISHWHYRHVDKLIALSDKMAGRLKEITNKPDSAITVLPQAPEKIYEKDAHDPKLEKRFSKGFNIVFTGNISPAQSFETIIEAAKKLQDDNITDINWIIVGDGMSRKWVEAQVKAAGLTNSFYFEGQKPIEDMPKYTAIADVLIGCLVKSDLLDATIPAKVMSYIASGKPIVLAMDGEAQKLISKTIGCGYAGPAEDSNILYENTKKIYLLTDSQRKFMGKRAREYHFKHFERNLILNELYGYIFKR